MTVHMDPDSERIWRLIGALSDARWRRATTAPEGAYAVLFAQPYVPTTAEETAIWNELTAPTNYPALQAYVERARGKVNEDQEQLFDTLLAEASNRFGARTLENLSGPPTATPQPDSAEFEVVCAELNAARIDAGATRGFDMFAGGFKYSDEVPRDIYNHTHLLAIVGVLRRLWGYRSFMIRGKTRRDLEIVWTAAKTLAPNWAGFDPTRCGRELAGELELALEESHRRIDEIVNL